MKKKTLSVLAAFLLCLLAVLPAFAAEGEDGFSGEYFRVMDMADLLGENEEEALLEKLDEISVRQEFEVAIATTDTLEGSTAKEYADDLFEYCDFGYGEGRDGVLLLVSLEDRDWWISTHGYGITAFTDAGIKYLSGRFLDELSEGNYAAAFDIYAEQCDAFLTQARTGKPYDKSNLPREPLGLMWIPIALAVGIALALLIVGRMKRMLKTVGSQAAAGSYVRKGSMEVTERRDLFLYRKVDRTEKPKEKDSGSSTHTSSSGRTHGGGGGKF